MKSFLERIIRLRNPQFKFDEGVDLYTIICLAKLYIIKLLRGFKLVFYGKMPCKIMLGKSVKLLYTKKIQLGTWVKIGNNVTLSGLGKRGVVFGDNVSIGSFSNIITSTSLNNIGEHITIGDNTGIGEFAYLGGGGGLNIGSDCSIGQYFSCHPENHNFENEETLMRYQGVTRKGIIIGNNCWVGSKVTILDGVRIGDNCVIAAGAVVTKSFENNSVIAGVPAKRIKDTYQKKEAIIKPIKTNIA